MPPVCPAWGSEGAGWGGVPRAGAAQRIKDGAIPEQVAAELGVSRSTLYRELRKHRDTTAALQAASEA